MEKIAGSIFGLGMNIVEIIGFDILFLNVLFPFYRVIFLLELSFKGLQSSRVS